MRRECRERFPRHRGLATPTCITARAWRTCRDACRDHWQAVSFEVGGGENVPGIPGAWANRNFTYLVRGPWTRPPVRHFCCCSGHEPKVFLTLMYTILIYIHYIHYIHYMIMLRIWKFYIEHTSGNKYISTYTRAVYFKYITWESVFVVFYVHVFFNVIYNVLI